MNQLQPATVSGPPLPPDEQGRLAALERYQIMDTPPEESFDRLARMSAALLEAPIGMVTFMAEDRQHFKACVGTSLTGNSRELAFCSHTILLSAPDDVMVVLDASHDERFMHNPVVTAAGVRFYAGVPLRSSDGYAIGTLCVYDKQPRESFSQSQRVLLRELAAIAVSELERRQAETELRAAAVQLARQGRRFELALTKARMAVWAIDLPGGQLKVYADFSSVGLPAAQVPTDYRQLSSILSAQEYQKLQAGIEQAADGNDFEAHYRLLIPGQLPLSIGVRGSVERGPDGQPLRLLGVAYDVTDERRAMRAQAESESKLRAIIEHTDDRITLKDVQGRFLLVNPAAARTLGFSEAALLGRTEPEVQGLVGPALTPSEQTVLDSGGMQTSEQEVSGMDGTRVWLTTQFPFLADDLRCGVITVSRDITERKQMEDVLRGTNLVLEQQVEARTGRLSEINAELTAFAASMSADVREPLRRLEGFLDLLEKRVELQADPTALRYLSVMRRESHRVSLLLQDLSEYARSGRRELQINRVALGQLVVQVRSDLEPLFRGRRVVWDVGELPTVLGDPMLLRQALTNVLHNALKFTREQPEARIELRAWAEQGEVILRVTDNGVGFSAGEAPRLFHIFTRLHDGRFEGAGVGLANVRRMVVRQGGRCWAEGQPDQGASIFIALPQLPE
jgi:PAS domain S-box-containing protein